MPLIEFLKEPEKYRDEAADFFRNEILPEAINQINRSFAPRRLSKQAREEVKSDGSGCDYRVGVQVVSEF
jgi:hypothetical protein